VRPCHVLDVVVSFWHGPLSQGHGEQAGVEYRENGEDENGDRSEDDSDSGEDEEGNKENEEMEREDTSSHAGGSCNESSEKQWGGAKNR